MSLERIRRVMRHPVRFEDGGVVRCLTLDEAAALMRRVREAIRVAHLEIAASDTAAPPSGTDGGSRNG